MNIPQTDLTNFQQAIQKAKNILVVTHEKPTIDSLAASLSLYLSLPSMGKSVTVACPDRVTVKVSNLVGIDKVINSLGSDKNFVISLDYTEGSIEKVSYNIEGEKFNLVIESRPGFSFSKDKVQFSEGSEEYDLVITVAIPDLSDLGTLHNSVKDLSDKVQIVNIDMHANNARYGKINLIYPAMGSVSEIMVFLLQAIKLLKDADSATNLFNGISAATRNFSAGHTTHHSFEAAAILLRAGAKRASVVKGEARPVEGSGFSKVKRTSLPSFGGQMLSPKIAHKPPTQKPRSSAQTDENDESAPPDWLKPKIFKTTKNNLNPPSEFIPSEGKARVS